MLVLLSWEMTRRALKWAIILFSFFPICCSIFQSIKAARMPLSNFCVASSVFDHLSIAQSHHHCDHHLLSHQLSYAKLVSRQVHCVSTIYCLTSMWSQECTLFLVMNICSIESPPQYYDCIGLKGGTWTVGGGGLGLAIRSDRFTPV